jgi:hypothetical protein
MTPYCENVDRFVVVACYRKLTAAIASRKAKSRTIGSEHAIKALGEKEAVFSSSRNINEEFRRNEA